MLQTYSIVGGHSVTTQFAWMHEYIIYIYINRPIGCVILYAKSLEKGIRKEVHVVYLHVCTRSTNRDIALKGYNCIALVIALQLLSWYA